MPKGVYIHSLKSEETKKKMSISHIGLLKGKPGRIWTDESKQKLSISVKGKKKQPWSNERKRKFSESLKGKSKWPNGRIFTDEWKQNISIGQTGKKQSIESNIKRSNALKGRSKPPCKEETRQKRRENRAKQTFPIKDTIPEKIVQNLLNQLNIEFTPHRYMSEIKHSYPCDIFIAPNKVIEVDGVYWHNYPYGKDIDKIRTQEMADKGFIVLRFWDKDILNDINYVKSSILNSSMEGEKRG